MSQLAYMTLLEGLERYSHATNTTNDFSKISIFGEITLLPPVSSDEKKEALGLILQANNLTPINTPETAEDPISLSNANYLKKKYNITNYADTQRILFITIPDEVTDSWLILDGVLVDPAAYKYWLKNLMEKGLSPRSPEELEADRKQEHEDKRLADLKEAEAERLKYLRPKKIEKIAVVRMHDTFINFQAAIFTLDTNNTTVKQLRSALTNQLGAQPQGTPMASTNAFTPDELIKRVNDSKKNTSLAFDSANRFTSVLDGKKHGQNPAVGVQPDQRSTLTDNVRLADIKGRVIVYIHPYPIPRTSFLEQLKEIGIDAAIDIVID
ncbi:hypothetical protein [Pseudomonas sp. McL0111]|uniref:hypothetical protein n=1 Tax=Pseudomonas sp. McL0111 TaxID=3457357 RepID=UPI00403E594C